MIRNESSFSIHFQFLDLANNKRYFEENFHMNEKQFDKIYTRINHHLRCKRNTRPNDNISPKAKLAMVLEFLASGSHQRHIASVYRVSAALLGRIIDQVCDAICVEFERDAFKTHTTADWLEIASQYYAKWNFPNCLGAIDGKHVPIRRPPNAGSLFFNYKV